MTKKLLALFLVVLMSINSLGAVVSDNDGSAFITKAEFDSLKNDFQSQIDQYNTSIDAKIDGAIASYLQGIRVAIDQRLPVCLSAVDFPTIRNYEIKNKYGIPQVDFLWAWYGTGHSNSPNWNKFPSSSGLSVVANGIATLSEIKMVGLKKGQESDYNDLSKNKFYWLGVSDEYFEKVSLAKLSYNDFIDPGGVRGQLTLRLFDTLKMDIENKCFSETDFNAIWKNNWLPLAQMYYSTGSSMYELNINPTNAGGFSSWTSSYDNETIKNSCELTWCNVAENVVCPTFTRSFYTFDDNLNRSNHLLDSLVRTPIGNFLKVFTGASKIPFYADGDMPPTDNWSYFPDSEENVTWARARGEAHVRPTAVNAEILDYTRGATTGGRYTIPTLGGLGPISSNEIYLQKDNLVYNFNGKEFTKNVTTMNEGYPLIYATQGTVITWEPTFSEILGSSAVTSNGEVKVILSYGQFGDGATSTGGYVQSDGSKGASEYTFTTSDKKVKIVWTMQEDNWIYAKWFPAALTSSTASTNITSNDKWSVTLDGAKSNNVIVKISN